MSKIKFTCCILFLLLSMRSMVSNAQDRMISRSVEWSKPVSVLENDSVIKLISFVNAFYPSGSKLPYWSEDFYGDAFTGNVSLDTCIYTPLTDSEAILIRHLVDSIPSAVNIHAAQVVYRKQKGIQVQFLPLVKDPSCGIISKLTSFRLRFEQIDTHLPTNQREYAANSVLSQGNWYKLGITHTGVYSIDYNDLVAMGINPSTVIPSKIGVFGRGGVMLPESNAIIRADDLPEIAIEVTGQGDGTFDPADQILFYAQGPVTWNYNKSRQMWEHTTHLYADTICYFLTIDQGNGKRIPIRSNSLSPETDLVTDFDFYTSYEENNLNLLGSGKRWFAQTYDVILNKTFSFDIPPLSAGGEVKVYTATAAKSYVTSTFGFTAGNQYWTASHPPVNNFSQSAVATAAYTYKILQSVTLPFKLDVKYNKAESTGVGYMDLIDVNARCELKFTGGQLAFRDSRSWGAGRVATFRLAEAAGKIRLWEVTDPVEPTAVENHPQGSDVVFKLATDTLRQYVAFDGTKLMKTIFAGKIANQNLHAITAADMIILTPKDFMPQAVRLATFHATESDLNVLVVEPTTIYNEYSSGTKDIVAIRDFVKMIYDRSGQAKLPSYLLLFGDASYDYKDKIPANTNFIPSWESAESFDPINSIVSDDFFGILDNNEGQSYYDRIDIGIGRLVIKSLTEAENAVDKIINYAVASDETQGDWKNIISFVADDEDYDHVDYSEEMAAYIVKEDPNINLDKIYLDAYIQEATPGGNRYPEVNKAITQRVEKGCLMINYTGHGGEKGWAHEEVLTVNEIKNWSNFNNLPVFVTATCEFSRFDDPLRQAAGEYVFTNPKGGGIALFTSTRATYGTPSFELNKKIFEYALSKPDGERLRMGDIIMNAKRDKGADENGRKYVLIGDPALQISFPKLNVTTTRINGRDTGSGMDTLKAYMEVTVEGMVTDAKGIIVNDFNGSVIHSVFDKPVTYKTLGQDGGSIFSFQLQKNLLYKGKVKVVNGRFSFTFVVPKDISYPYGPGKISYYATNGNIDAYGNNSNIIIGGSAASGVSDTQGPVIQLYMNNTLFRDGGITDQNPWMLAFVSDENGINTIGNGIGHDITAILDNNTSEPFILNEFYESDIDTYKSGSIWFPFSMLAPGEHTLTLKVWDVFNNSSEANIRFVVNNSGEFIIDNVYNFPNPFRESTNIVFEHNQKNIEFTTRVEIYSVTGHLVRIIEQTDNQTGSVSTPITWDGTNDNGSLVPAGMYFCRLKVRTSEGQYAEKTGKMIFIK